MIASYGPTNHHQSLKAVVNGLIRPQFRRECQLCATDFSLFGRLMMMTTTLAQFFFFILCCCFSSLRTPCQRRITITKEKEVPINQQRKNQTLSTCN